MLSAATQEWIAWGIVGAVGLLALRTVFRATLAEPFSAYLLKRGQVKWAMRVKHGICGSGKGGCH